MLYIDSIWEYIVNFLELALFIIFIHKKLRIRANYKHQAVLMFLFVDGKCYEQMSTLNKIIVHLPSEFIRTHRSYIVNMAHIYRITSGTIELSNHLTTQIARSYSKDVISAFAKYTTRFDTSGDFE